MDVASFDVLFVILLFLGGAVALFCCGALWIWFTGCASHGCKQAYARYFIRGVVKRKDKGIKFTATEIEPGLFLGSLPHMPEHLMKLRKDCGVSAVLTLNETWELPFFLAVACILEKNVVTDGGGGTPKYV
eukprot:SAG11_NODE_194_length_12858_cov_28.436946_8_plen_131_part_00